MSKTAIKGSDITKENVDKLLAFSDDEIAVTSADEKQGIAAALIKRSEDIKFQIDTLKESSGINALDSEDKRIKLFLDKIKLSLNDINQMPDNSVAIINVHNDAPSLVVNDDDDLLTEQSDVVVASYVVEKKTFLVPNDDIVYRMYLLKLIDLDLKCYLKLGKVRLSLVNNDSLINLINELNNLGLIDSISILPSLYTALLEQAEKKQELIDGGFIHAVSDISIDKAKNRQLSLFRDEEEIALDIIPLDAEDVSAPNDEADV